jgi:ankyrin repeat protein
MADASSPGIAAAAAGDAAVPASADDLPSSTSSCAFAPPTRPAALGKNCALCGADFSGGKRLMRCGGCRATHYCSREHQAAHWDAHARDCAAEVARREAQEQAGGLVLGAEAAAARAEEKAAAAAAAEAAEDRARIEALDVAALRLELDRRGALAGLPEGASREALIAARLCAPAPTPETLEAAAEREERASLLRACRLCEKALAAAEAGVGPGGHLCAVCKRVRFCGSACFRTGWPRHRQECVAWKAEAALGACRACGKAIPREPADAGRCSVCRRVRYCGAACQRGDWPRHKPECAAGRAEAAAAASRRLGGQLIRVIGIVAKAGFAAEVSHCLHLCGATWRRGDEGATNDMLARSLERQCGARVAHAAEREDFLDPDNGRMIRGTTQLMRAAALNNLPRVLQLVQLGAPLELKDKSEGWSAMHRACWDGHEHVARALLDSKYEGRGAEVDALDLHRQTPLVEASYNGHEGVVRLLLARGARQELQSSVGQTALHNAIFSNHAGTVTLLCAAPGAAAALALQNNTGQTPLDFAILMRHAACEAVLRKRLRQRTQ